MIDLSCVYLGNVQLPQLEVFELSLYNLDLNHGQVQLGWLGCNRCFVFKLSIWQCFPAAAFLADLPSILQPQDEQHVSACGLSRDQHSILQILQIASVNISDS